VSSRLDTFAAPPLSFRQTRQEPSQRSAMEEEPNAHSKADELRAFLLLSVLMAPVLAVLIVSGYGFLVWMFQLVAGPPGN
jgi:periplasmic nitrate reductase NapE